jgi:hypothetical protein
MEKWRVARFWKVKQLSIYQECLGDDHPDYQRCIEKVNHLHG